MPHVQNTESVCTRKANIAGQTAEARSGAPASLNVEARTVRVALATETPVRAWTEYGIVDEVLLMSGASWPQRGQVPLLDTHSRYSVTGQLGSVRAFAVNGDSLEAEAHFSEIAEQAFTLVREGHLTDVSVSCRILEHVFVPEGTPQSIDGRSFAGPVKIITRWEVLEGSFTPIGADKNAKTRAAFDGDNREVNPMPNKMDDTNVNGRAQTNNGAPNKEPQVKRSPADGAPQEADRSEASPAKVGALPAEPSADSMRAETAAILHVARTHCCYDLAERAISEGKSANQFNTMVIEYLAQRSEQYSPGHVPTVEMGQSDSEKYRSAAADSLLCCAGSQYAPENPSSGSQEFLGFTLRELARECLRRAGIPVPANPMDMVGRAFTHSTSDFPFILADVAHKAVMTGVQEAAETLEIWTGDSTVNDFREYTGVDLNGFTNLAIVLENGEYTDGTISDRGIRYSVATYGRMFSISRQAIINDDLNVFTRIPAAMGRAAMRTCGNAVYSLLIDNPQMPDGNALFSPPHNNLASSGSAVNAASYTEAVTKMGTHAGEQDEILSIPPRFMLLPVSRQAEAFTFLNSQVIGTQASPNQVNPWYQAVSPVVEGRLDAVASKPWFLMGQKSWTINTAWLFGNKTPRVEQREGWRVDGTQFKVSLDFGAYVQDWRAMFKNPGA